MDIRTIDYEEEKVILCKKTEIEINGKLYIVDLSDLKKQTKLDECVDYTISYQKVKMHDKEYYIYTKNDNLFITTNLNNIWRRKSVLFSHAGKNAVYFYGLYSNIENRYQNCDFVYIEDKLYSRVHRPFKFWKFRHIAIIKVKYEDILVSGAVHSRIAVGDDKGNTILVSKKKKYKGINYYSRKKYKNQYILVRSTVNGSAVRIVNIPMAPEYTMTNMLKNNIAHFIGKIVGKKDIILLFEKETKKANESGYYIFEKIMQQNSSRSKVYYVIDKHCSDFKKVYSKYPTNTLKKYSFKHYLYIYLSKYFISSELPNHVINPRLYLRNLNREIAKKPLIFLQHGIMFAKPVENPAAAGFQKSNRSVNYFKTVISSDLEATQFFKCGFNRNDLIKCGLTKFDISRMNEDADKILIMLTYRYWEEAMVMNPDTIKDTTYYHSYMKLIHAFEEAGLLNKLIISCHPKFYECIIMGAPKYENIMEKDINKALENSRIFITDYSSASYDAHYRGAYIIYYWAEREYLIENYKAVPPINEDNCDGVPVFDVDSLICEVKRAIKNNYKMDEMYEERYKKINEFHDNRNGERFIEELKKLEII